MIQTLRINGVVADIDKSMKVNLSYKSPIFGDLQKLSANTTYTIKLPLTAANRALIGNVEIVGVESGLAYNYFRVDYQRDGLPVIDDGIGYLLSIAEQIEISVIFGGVSNFASFKEAKLNDMPIPVEQGQIMWYGSKFADQNTSADIMFLPMAFGRDVPITTQYAHPVVRVPKIIDWINQAYGINMFPIGQGLVVPCVTKKRHSPAMPKVFVSVNNRSHGQSSFVVLDNCIKQAAWSCHITLSVYDEICCLSSGTYRLAAWTIGSPDIEITKIGFIKNMSMDTQVEWWVKGSEGGGDHCDVDLEEGGLYSFYVEFEGSTAPCIPVRFEIAPVSEDLLFCEDFDTLHNLPAMKVVDFVKAIMQIEGKFPQLTPDGVEWVSVDDLYSNIKHAIDWSDKINKVVSHDFRIDDYAQQNMCIWAEDDTVELVDSAIICVGNKTLEAKKDMIKLPFAASDEIRATFESPDSPTTFNGGWLALIPIYSKEVDDDGTETINYDAVKPRIVAETTGIRGLYGRFPDRIHLSGDDGIVKRCYSKYQEVIRQPRVVKCEALLTTQDIAELDMMRPVYVEQLNGYLAVLSVITKDNTSDVELLKL